MLDWLSSAVDHAGERSALTFDGQSWTYPELDRDARRVQSALAAHGVDVGVRVGIHLDNSPLVVMLVHAVIRLGAVLVPLNRRIIDAELVTQLALCSVVVSDRPLAHPHQIDPEALLRGDPSDAPLQPLELSRTFAIIHTSGTSGVPKAAELSLAAVHASAVDSLRLIGSSSDDRWLCCLPLFHIGGLLIVVRAALSCASIDLQASFSVAGVSEALGRGATLVSLVPTQLHRLLDAGIRAGDPLRMVLLGGAAATPDLVTRAASMGYPVATTYGLSEASSMVALQLPEATLRKPGSVGTVISPGARVQIIGADGLPCPVDEIGEIVVDAPTLMRGYLGNPQATARTLLDNQLHTGDLGYLDSDGDLWVVQRRSDLIVSGGENVYPAEVEQTLKAHPAIRDACVVGIPHPEWGQQVAALIVSDEPLTLDNLRSWLRDRLAGYKQPRLMRIVDALPVNAAGKIDRTAVIVLLTQ